MIIFKTVKIVFKALLAIIAAVILFACVYMLISHGFFENYSNWSKKEVPTDTDVQVTVKIPDEWEFVVIDELVYIKDGDKVVASEISQGYNLYKKLNENQNESLYDLFDTYTACKSIYVDGGSCVIYEYDFGEQGKRYVMEMNVFVSPDGDYGLLLLFEKDSVTLDDLIKIERSHRYPRGFNKYLS